MKSDSLADFQAEGSREHANGPAGLLPAELSLFSECGWIGPFPLLPAEIVARLSQAHYAVATQFTPAEALGHTRTGDAFERRPWFKSMHAYLSDFCDVACHPSILNKVSAILGPDILIWGQTTTIMAPGQTHRWHVDVEHSAWSGVTAFVGLQNTCRDTTLKVITGSHRIDAWPQQLGVGSDFVALAASRCFVPSCELVAPDVHEGDFFIFEGRIWHGSSNTGDKTRIATIIQYARPDASIRIPLNWDAPVRWHPYAPPCVLACGEDRFGLNRLVSRPRARPATPNE